MTWTSAADLQEQVERLWTRGLLLRAAVTDAIPWPLRLRLRGPTAGDLSERFDEVRDWSRALGATPHVRLEWREWNHRVQGRQQLPAQAWLDSLNAALELVGRRPAAERFVLMWQRLTGQRECLRSWLLDRPHEALAVADVWESLLSVVAWVTEHPRSNVYLRQVDVPGVDSKFIESHRGALSALLDLALPTHAIATGASGAAQFARRYGFAEPPARVRFRVLDAAMPTLPGVIGSPDITLDATSFARLSLPVRRVVITENETNFLALPPLPETIGIFGSGYGFDTLAAARWLDACELLYWGDIDTHGFAILNQLRDLFPEVRSVLMDRETLLRHRAFWGSEPKPVRHDLTRLTADEGALYDDLRFDRLQPSLRLEQERVAHQWVTAAFARSNDPAPPKQRRP